MSKRILILLLIGLMLLAGCDPTGDTNTDAEAAQSFLPTFEDYTTYETESVQTAITTALGGTSALTGNPVQAALIERIDSLLSCYREVGAVDANIFIESVANVDELRLPRAGVLVVINQDRVKDNFIACLTQDPLEGVMSFNVPEPCAGSGEFTFEGDKITFAYVASDTPLCDQFIGHFAQFGAVSD